jgi:hypothetical protein
MAYLVGMACEECVHGCPILPSIRQISYKFWMTRVKLADVVVCGTQLEHLIILGPILLS